MYTDLKITPPFFEFGPKAYVYGQDLLDLARRADRISEAYQVQIIITSQAVDIPLLAAQTRRVLVFAQHMDSLRPGRGVGSVLPEAVKAAGALGVMLNHAEKPLPLDEIERTIRRADEVGLATMVCAGSSQELEAVARMGPNIILAENPETIGTGKRDAQEQAAIQKINAAVWNINPEIRVLHGAGISCGQDVYDVMALGAQGTGSSSGIVKAPDPAAMLEEMVRAAREGWGTPKSSFR